MKLILLFAIFTLLGAFGGFFVKKATMKHKSLKLFINRYIFVGGVLYVLSALLNIVALKYLPYTIVLPLTSITYVWTLLISYFFLKEKLNIIQISGVLFIVIGTICIGLSL